MQKQEPGEVGVFAKKITGYVNKNLLLVVSVATLFFFSLIGFFTYTQLYEQRYEFTREIKTRLSSQVASAMNLWLNEKVDQARMLSNLQLIKDYCSFPADDNLRQRVEVLLTTIHKSQPYLTHIDLVLHLPEGQEAAHFVEDGKLFTVENDEVLVDSVGGRHVGKKPVTSSYLEAFTAGAPTFITEALTCHVSAGTPVIMVVAPVKGSDGVWIGSVSYEVRLDYFTRLFISGFSLGGSGEIEIVDDRGFLIGSADASKILNPKYLPEGKAILTHLSADTDANFDLNLHGKVENYAATHIMPASPMASKAWVFFHRPNTDIHLELLDSLLGMVFLCATSVALILFLTHKLRKALVGMREVEDAKRRQAYVDSAPYGLMLVHGSTGRIMDANPAAYTLFDYSQEEFSDLDIYTLLPHISWDAVSDAPHDEELTGNRKGGVEIIVVCSIQPMGEDTLLLCVRDETELVRRRVAMEELSQNLARSLGEAEAASKAKTEFIANMSHEIRTPMNAIIGFTHLIQKTPLTSQQQDYIGKTQSAAKLLLAIINDILDFSKIEASRLVLEDTPFSPRQTVSEVYSLFTQTCNDKGVMFTLNITEEFPAVVSGDSFRLAQVLTNIISNAVKFTEQGSINFYCSAVQESANTAMLSFMVKDTGIGLSPDQQKNIFSAFTQADTSVTRKYGGTGLGLVICKRIVNLMGGDLTLESEERVGTTVAVSCRFKVMESTPAFASGLADASAAENAPPDTAILQGATVLLVEDNFINQQIAQELLEAVGLNVLVADNGQVALEIATQQRGAIDVILMDIQMPVMDGYTAAQELRKTDLYKKTPIIAMTAHAFREERERCEQLGMNGHIAKPIDVSQLYHVISTWLKIYRQT